MNSAEEQEKRITRRKFVKGAAVVGAGVLAGCASPAKEVIKETVEVPLEVTKIVEVPVEVTKIVEVAGGAAGGPITLEVLDPSGAFQVSLLHAARLDDLEGKTICELSNNIWQSWRTFPLIRELLKQRYPTIKIIPWEELVDVEADFEANSHLLTDLGCDAAIIGNAG